MRSSTEKPAHPQPCVEHAVSAGTTGNMNFAQFRMFETSLRELNLIARRLPLFFETTGERDLEKTHVIEVKHRTATNIYLQKKAVSYKKYRQVEVRDLY